MKTDAVKDSKDGTEDVQILESQIVAYPNDRDITHMKKDLTWLGMFAAAYNMSNSWLVVAATMGISLIYGPVMTIWTLISIVVLYFFIGVTVAELIAAYPTTGGQYHWTSILAPPSIRRIASYYCGFMNWFSWLAMAASSQGAICQCVFALIQNHHPDFIARPWHSFLLYEAMTILSVVANLFCHKGFSQFYFIGFLFSLASFITIMITCLARSKAKQTAEFVWTSHIEGSGWSTGVEFLIALSAPMTAFCPTNGAVHLVEEVVNASIVVPRTFISSLVISFATTLAFVLSMMYCITDIDAVLTTPSGFVLFEIWEQATRSDACSIVFTIVILLLLPFGSIACTQVSSMMTLSLARDQGLSYSLYLASINQKLGVPVISILLNFVFMFLIGILYLISTLAFNATVGVAAIFQMLTIAIPPLLLLYHRRSAAVLPPTRKLVVPQWLGFAANIATVIIGITTTVFFQFPAFAPVTTSSSMNYACVLFFCVILVATLNWVFYARKYYDGPLAVDISD